MELSQLRVLLVDDMQSVRMVARACLKHIGVQQVRECCNGHEAWQELERGQYDLVISDWEMPDMDGLTLLYRIRQHQALKDLPFLMLTATASAELVRQCKSVGVTAYLVKPFQPLALQQKIVRIFNARPGSASAR